MAYILSLVFLVFIEEAKAQLPPTFRLNEFGRGFDPPPTKSPSLWGSCVSRCDEYRFDVVAELGCHCDDNCEANSDCCWDREKVCRASSSKDEKINRVLCQRFVPTDWTRSHVLRLFGFNKIVGCSKEFEAELVRRDVKELETVRRRCSAGDRFEFRFPANDLFLQLPVTMMTPDGKFGFTYANVFCFYCNVDSSLPTPKLVFWSARVSLDDETGVEIDSGAWQASRGGALARIAALIPPDGYLDFSVKSRDRRLLPCLLSSARQSARNSCPEVEDDVVVIGGREDETKPKWSAETRLCVSDVMTDLFADESTVACLNKTDGPFECFVKVPRPLPISVPDWKRGYANPFSGSLSILIVRSKFSVREAANETRVWKQVECPGNSAPLKFFSAANESEDEAPCANLNQLVGVRSSPSNDNEESVQSILTKFGLGLSVASLILSLFIFYAIQGVEKGRVMRLQLFLVLSLLGYNLCFLTRTQFPSSCTVAAMALHLFLLCSFCWSTCVAAYVFGSFYVLLRHGTLQELTLNDRVRKFDAVVHLVCWGVPCSVTLTCILFDKVVFPGSVGYGATEDCWIGDDFAQMIAFAVPTFVSLGLNLVLVGASMVALTYLRLRCAKLRTDRRFVRRREVALVAARLLAVVGAQWLFGFILYFCKNSVVEFLFVAFTSLQGFFVFLSLATTRTARRLARAWLTARTICRSSRVTPTIVIAAATSREGREAEGAPDAFMQREPGRTTQPSVLEDVCENNATVSNGAKNCNRSSQDAQMQLSREFKIRNSRMNRRSFGLRYDRRFIMKKEKAIKEESNNSI